MKEDILKLISILYRKTQMYFNEKLIQLNLSSSQGTFLICICKCKEMPQNKLCELLDMDKSTVAKMLIKLEQEGYVTRKTNSEDCRSLTVYPTQKAYDVYPKVLEAGEDWGDVITKGFNTNEKDMMCDLLLKATHNAANYFNDK